MLVGYLHNVSGLVGHTYYLVISVDYSLFVISKPIQGN